MSSRTVHPNMPGCIETVLFWLIGYRSNNVQDVNGSSSFVRRCSQVDVHAIISTDDISAHGNTHGTGYSHNQYGGNFGVQSARYPSSLDVLPFATTGDNNKMILEDIDRY